MTEEVKKDEFGVSDETLTNKDLLLPGLSDGNPPILAKGTIKDGDATNQDGQPLEIANASDKHEVVIDKVSGNPVLVQKKFAEDKRAEFEKMLDEAHDSLKGAGIGEVGIGHPYFGLMNRARQFGKEHNLI